VVIDFREWLRIVKNYGIEHTVSGLNKLYINRKTDGSCPFLNNGSTICPCELQYMKPRACQLWPFKVLPRPEFGYANEASFLYLGKEVFVYADPMCRGLRLGRPTVEFSNHTLEEFVEISAGIRSNQFRSTGRIGFSNPFTGLRVTRDSESF
jgi:Fe-S-cluster containining protein